MLVDRFGRRITNLRIAVTMKCNLNCIYCHREGQSCEGEELSVEEIAEIARAFHELGIRKVKITGGEPLLRKDICDIVAEMPPFQEVSITTNGTLLSRLAEELKEVGLNRVNVSLDSLRDDIYSFVTGGGKVERVIEGIEAACNAELTPVKINMVVMKGINDDQIKEMMGFVSSLNRDGLKAILQLIEILKLPGLEKYYLDISEIEKEIASKAEAVLLREMHFRRQYLVGNAAVEFVKPVDNSEFCMHCNRIRVTSDGRIKPCLLREDNTVNARGLKGEKLVEAIKKAVELREPYYKPE